MRFNTPTGKRCIYYFPEWGVYGRNYQVKNIPDYITDVAYAFFNIDSTGKVYSGDPWATTDKRYSDGVPPQDSWNDTDPNSYYGNFGQFRKLLASGRQLNLQLSIGGWTWSKYFSDAVSTPQNRTNLVNNIIQIFNKYKIFNGVSIDWEYLSDNGVNYGNDGNISRPQDPDNFIEFLKLLRASFNSNGMSDYVISFCCTAAPEKAKWPVEKIHPLIDELHVMTYDFHSGNWGETKTAHHTNPRKSSYGSWSCEEAADFYLSKGVPSNKLFIGGAFYSRGFANTAGLGQPAQGGSPDKSWEDGVVDYKALPITGAIEYQDPESKANYSYDSVRKVFNSYDGQNSILEKCKIINEKNLAGMIIWDISSDFIDTSNPRCLTKLIKDNLTHKNLNTPPNNLPTQLPPSTTQLPPSTTQPPPSTTQPPVYVPPDVILYDGIVNYLFNKYHAIIKKTGSNNYLTLSPVTTPPTTTPPTTSPTPPTTTPPTTSPTPPTTTPPTTSPTTTPQTTQLKISFILDYASKTMTNIKIE